MKPALLKSKDKMAAFMKCKKVYKVYNKYFVVFL